MVYLCGIVTDSTNQHVAFKARGIAGTQERISRIQYFGVPRERQLAYAGYKSGISAFLRATAISAKVLVAEEDHPIPHTYEPNLPFPYPRVVFAFSGNPPASFVAAFREKLGDKMEKAEVGKGPDTFTITNANYSQLYRGVLTYGNPKAYFINDHIQCESIPLVLKVSQILSLFLATNTYPYRRGVWKEIDSKKRSADVAQLTEFRTAGSFFRTGKEFSAKSWKPKVYGTKSELGEPGEKDDLTPHINVTTPSEATVHVAKPSPIPTSSNIGMPRDVPNIGGLVFPYFEELLSPDVAGFRKLLVPFIQSFAEPGTNCRDAFSRVRDQCQTYVRTKEGVMMTHILAGCNLALDCQAQLYLLVESGKYLGFCLLGEEFDVNINGIWHAAVSARELQLELQTIGTHEGTLEKVAAQLGVMTSRSGMNVEVAASEIDTAVKLMRKLALVDRGTDDAMTKELVDLLKRLSFSVNYKKVSNVDDVIWAIHELSDRRTVPLDDDVPCYIPLDDWSGLDEKTFQVFSAFGSRGFSFRNAGGVEYVISKTGDKDLYDEKDEKTGKEKFTKLQIAMRPLKACVNDWRDMMKTGKIRQNFAVRAAGSMYVTVGGDVRRKVWVELQKLKDQGLIGDRDIVRALDDARGAPTPAGPSRVPNYSTESLDF